VKSPTTVASLINSVSLVERAESLQKELHEEAPVKLITKKVIHKTTLFDHYGGNTRKLNGDKQLIQENEGKVLMGKRASDQHAGGLNLRKAAKF
jgi:hypothetical protein